MPRSTMLSVGTLLLCLVCTSCYRFEEDFAGKNPADDLKKWTSSELFGADQGKMIVARGKYTPDPRFDMSLKTSEDSKHYGYSRSIPEFATTGKPLVIQFSVRHEQLIDCGGGYIKLMSNDGNFDPKNFGPDSPFAVMFGPDICGAPVRQTRIVLTYKGKVAHVKKLIRCETDEVAHLYTLVIKPDRTYDVLIDNKKIEGGSILDDFDLLEKPKIPDKTATKPSDWDDNARIPDPEHKKPSDWDDHKPAIADPSVKKPETWDDEMDGEWTPPIIANPEYVGEWKQRMIPNPAYKGNWSAPMLDNPEFVDDKNVAAYKLGHVGFEIWQVKSGSYFDNILITDNIMHSRKVAEDILNNFFQEKDIKTRADEMERAKKEAERKRVEWSGRSYGADRQGEADDADSGEEAEALQAAGRADL